LTHCHLYCDNLPHVAEKSSCSPPAANQNVGSKYHETPSEKAGGFFGGWLGGLLGSERVMRKHLCTFALCVAFVLGLNSQAKAVSVIWGSEEFTGILDATSNNLFGAGEINFDGFLADELTSIFGGGYYHTHGSFGTVDFVMEIQLDGVWSQIWNDVTPSIVTSDNFLLEDIEGPISFALGMVSGIRLFYIRSPDHPNGDCGSGCFPIGEAFHMSPPQPAFPSTIFNFSTTVIPLPAAFPLFGTGLGILGFLGWRRRRKMSSA
jgi:hypothetical protein